MNTKKTELELGVDFIGGQGSLTPEEEKALNDFFKQRKFTTTKTLLKSLSKTAKLSKVNT
ncbi:MAG: hypothetical protein JST20_07940 [Bacteroidetes bacterium]|nr:hypothetical protein [Bacteroidota bacterium]